MRLLGQVLTWAITIVVIRLLSPNDYGLLAMATVFVKSAGRSSWPESLAPQAATIPG